MFTILLLFFFGLKTQDREREGLCIQYYYPFFFGFKIEKKKKRAELAVSDFILDLISKLANSEQLSLVPAKCTNKKSGNLS